MGKTLFKDIFREIKKSFSRFIAILAIIAIGITFFVGIKMTCPDMKITADQYFKDNRLMDFYLVSSVGFNKEDIESIKKVDGIKGIMPSYSIDAMIDIEDTSYVVKINSLPNTNDENYINRPLLVSGRLPTTTGECVIEKSNFKENNFEIGSKIKLTSGNSSNILDNVSTDEFIVVGIVQSPLYISKERGTSVIGNGKISTFMIIQESDFKLPVYNGIYITASNSEGSFAYTDEYDNKIESLRKSLEDVATVRSNIRYEDIKLEANIIIQNKESELKTAQANFANVSKYLTLNQKNDSTQEFATAEKEIQDAKDKIGSLPKVTWHVLDRKMNVGYVEYENAADRMDAISKVFPIIFVLVAILICFTSIGRLVDEQRIYIGTMKALGYRKRFIVLKYLIYASFASIIGGIIGILIGFTAFPSFFANAYSALYTLPKLILQFDNTFAILVMIAAVLVTSLSAITVCYETLMQNTASLMVVKAPKPGKIILLERIPFIWNRLKFTHKVTARNLFRYKSRFFMTVVGVAGCTALLLVGFALKDSIGTIGTKQFGEIYTYQMSVNTKDGLSKSEYENISNLISNIPNYEAKLNLLLKSIDIGLGSKESSCNIIVPEDTKGINDYITLHDRVSQQKYILSDNEVILTEKLANVIGAKIGDDIYIKNGEKDKYKVKVSGITENYLLHYLYMSPKLYENLYLIKPEYNQIDVKLTALEDSQKDIISKSIVSSKGVASVTFSNDMLKTFVEMINTVNYVVLILIVAAALLSFIVLYTLTNINISERIREIATIKVLGFYEKEVSSYVYRENLILTLIGSLFGLILGFYLAKFVIGTAEVEMLMFGREIYPMSFVISVLLTLVFAWFVNVVLLKKIKNINMVEALKTVE
ncbi:MAG: ABC transporter permease [Clostridia bacterium]|nr:ABC transporter permease [Clostridia bacterium]MDD4387266.1 ABC transporter permease [Clostridia bacterium]